MTTVSRLIPMHASRKDSDASQTLAKHFSTISWVNSSSNREKIITLLNTLENDGFKFDSERQVSTRDGKHKWPLLTKHGLAENCGCLMNQADGSMRAKSLIEYLTKLTKTNGIRSCLTHNDSLFNPNVLTPSKKFTVSPLLLVPSESPPMVLHDDQSDAPPDSNHSKPSDKPRESPRSYDVSPRSWDKSPRSWDKSPRKDFTAFDCPPGKYAQHLSTPLDSGNESEDDN